MTKQLHLPWQRNPQQKWGPFSFAEQVKAQKKQRMNMIYPR